MPERGHAAHVEPRALSGQMGLVELRRPGKLHGAGHFATPRAKPKTKTETEIE